MPHPACPDLGEGGISGKHGNCAVKNYPEKHPHTSPRKSIQDKCRA